jgi:RimJ/RimL family protein N-acetyltransferase
MPQSLTKKDQLGLEPGPVRAETLGTPRLDAMASECKPVPVNVESPTEGTVVLRGTEYVLRRLRPDDEKRLQDFFYSHSQETIQLRYGYMISTMTHERAYELVNVDQQKDVALGIFETSGKQEILHAVGRFYSEPEPNVAEVAFVARESKRRCGMASVLLRRLGEIAQRSGLRKFTAQVLRENEAMRSLFSHYSPEVSSLTGSSWLTYTFSIETLLKKMGTAIPVPRPPRGRSAKS